MKLFFEFSTRIIAVVILTLISSVSAQTIVNKQLYLSDPAQTLDRIDPVATADVTTTQTATLSIEPVVWHSADQTFASGTSGNTQTVNRPTNVQAGDLIIVTLHYRVTITTITPPAGFQLISNVNGGGAVGSNTATVVAYYKIATASEPTTYSFTSSSNNSNWRIVANRVTGHNPENPIGNQNGSTSGTTDVTTRTVNSINTTMPNSLLVTAISIRDIVTNLSEPSGMSPSFVNQARTVAKVSYQVYSSSGATGNKTWTWTTARDFSGLMFVINSAFNNSSAFTQAPTLCSPLTIKAGQPLTITNYITVLSGSMPANPNITATLKYGSTTIATLTNPTYNSGTGLLTFTTTIGSDVTVPAGQTIVFEITTAQSGVTFRIDYDSQTKPSKIELPVSTFININSYAVYDAAYPNGSVITNIPTNTTVYLRAVVEDPFGSDDITGVTINVSPGGAILTPSLVATYSCTRTYEISVNTNGLDPGEYSIPATAKEGYENSVSHTYPLTVQLCTPIETPVFTLGTTSTRCQGAGTITYTATSTNSTSITYTLDANSLAAGNSIVASTGAVTYVTGWSGTSTINAIAVGCDGTRTSNHTVTITPSVGTPVFALGATSTRCMESGNETYSATASNSTGVTYTLDATSIAAGNTINALTGVVSYIASWSGTSTITATATGCNESTIGVHTVTTIAIDATDDIVSGDQGSPIIINALTNDFCNINPTSLSIQSNPLNGTLQIGTNGQITYLPNGDFFGTDEFTYQICSNGTPAICDVATVTVIVNQTFNDPCSEATQAKTFYIPFPENSTQLRKALWSASSVDYVTNNVRTILSIKSPYHYAVITYDHWEDGYEADITLPIQSTTLVWGDGNLTNGVAPGYPTDIIPAGGYIVIDNQFQYNPRVASTIVFDGKDKMYSTADVAVSVVKGDAGNGGGVPTFLVQNIKTNVYDITRFGKFFIIPFGEDITLGNTGAFKYTGIFIRAANNGTIINLDYNGDEVVDVTQTLNEGEVYYYDGTASTPGVAGNTNQSNDLKAGGSVTSNFPVGVDLVFGGIDSYGTRNLALLPGQFYGNTYYSPVHTTLSTAPVYAFFTNTLSTPITVNWTAGTTPATTGSVVIPANGANYLSLSQTAGYKFQSAGGESFTAVAVIDADASGADYDWAFNMITEDRLTTFSSVAWAPGSSDGSGNYNPVWVTPQANTTLYVKFNGNIPTVTETMSPCNMPYDIAIPLNALQSYKILDTDNDQSGMAIYTCDDVKIAAVWGQDPNAGNPTPTGSPAMDVGYVMEPRCLQQNVFAINDIEYTQMNSSVVVDVISNDNGFLCTLNPSSISNLGLLQANNGTVVINSDGTITYTPNADFEGTDVFEYRVYSNEFSSVSSVARVTIKVADCAAIATENLITGKVFIEQLPDDGLYNDEAFAKNVKVDLYIDTNCNSTIDAGENIVKSTFSDLSGNYDFHVQNGLNAKDNFDPTASYSGNDGGINWTANWVEQGDNTNFTTGDVRIMTDVSFSGSGNAIRIAGATNGISRSLTFSGATSETLRFSYRRQGLDNEGEALNVQVNGITVYTIQDGDYAGGTDDNYTEIIIPITSYNANGSNTVLFVTNGTPAVDDYFWIDNVELIYFKDTGCYITKVDPSNTNGHYSVSTLNTQTASFTNLGNCDINNYLGVKVNLVPTNDAASTAVDVPVIINVLSNDVIGIPNSATVTTTGMINQPANGTLTVNTDGTITYTPNQGFVGVDDFEYSVCSLEDPGICNTALVTVTISCVSTPGINVVSGVIYQDLNTNGVLDVTDTKQSGVGVNLYRDTDNDGVLDAGEPLIDTKTSSSVGAYQFNIAPPVVASTYRDEFTVNTTANQSVGTTSWTTNAWNEIGTTNGLATTPIRITSANGLAIEGNGTATVLGAYRIANLSTAIAATLSFNYAETGLDLQVNDYVDVQIATSTSPSNWTLLKRYTGGDGNQTGFGSFDITPFLSATTTIRFVTSGSTDMTASNIIYFDNVQISYNVATASNYIVQLTQPFYGFRLTNPSPNPTGIHSASFTGAGDGDCGNNFGLAALPIAENDINQTPMNIQVAGQLMTNDEGVTIITAATFGGNTITINNVTPFTVSGIDKHGNAVSNAGNIIINSDGTYIFMPAVGFNGIIDPIIYTGADTFGATDNAILNIEVFPKVHTGNNPPVAHNDVSTTEINIPLSSTVITNDSDPDGDVLTITNASINTTSITIGSPITVSGVNSAGNSVTNAGTLTLNADGTYTFIPALEFTGVVDNILYTISDSKGGADIAILNISVIGNVGNNTFANDDANSASKDVNMTGNVLTNDFDPEGNTHTITLAAVNGNTITIGSANVIENAGSLTLNADGTYTFDPLATFVGTISVIYEKCDNGTPVACDQATLYLTSVSVNFPPIAINDVNSTFINTSVSGRVLTNDISPEGYPLTVNAETKPTSGGGTVTINENGSYTYTPAAEFTTEDTFTYTVCNNADIPLCTQATVSIKVIPVPTSDNDAPVAVNDAYVGIQTKKVKGKLLNNDFEMDGDAIFIASAMYDSNGDGTPDIPLSLSATTTVWGINFEGQAIEAGTLVLNPNGHFTFNTNETFGGKVIFSYLLSDDTGQTDDATVTIDIIDGNSTYAVDDMYFGFKNNDIIGNLLANDFDPEEDVQEVVTAPVSNPLHGTVVLNADGSFTYTPNAGYVGTDRFVYEIYDTENPPSRDSATVYFNIASTYITLTLKAKLQGAMVNVNNTSIYSTDGLMRDDLRKKGLISLTSPYIGLTNSITDPTTVLADLAENSIVDWVYVEIRSALKPATVITSTPGLIQRDGDIVDVDGVSPLIVGDLDTIASGTAYISVRHRNHLGVMTGLPVDITNSVVYNFTTDSLYKQAGIKENPSFIHNGIKMLWGGDVNSIGQIRYTGTNNAPQPIYTSVLTNPSNILKGTSYLIKNLYNNTDCNLDGNARFTSTGNDKNLVYTNIMVNSKGNTFKGTGYTAFYDNLP